MAIVLETRAVDEVMDALNDAQRRNLLLDLLEHTTQDGPPPTIVGPERDADAISHLVSMKHTHIPILDTYDFIDWEERHQTVTRGSNFEQIRPFLEVLQRQENELYVEQR